MLIKNATLYTAVRAEPVQEDISLEHGKIKAIAPGISPAGVAVATSRLGE